MSMSSCSNCTAGDKDWLKLKTDLLIIDSLDPKNLMILIEQLLIDNDGYARNICLEIDSLFQRGYILYGTILSKDLPKDIPTSLNEQRNFAKEIRMLNLKLKLLSGNITNLKVQLICPPPD